MNKISDKFVAYLVDWAGTLCEDLFFNDPINLESIERVVRGLVKRAVITISVSVPTSGILGFYVGALSA